MKPETIKDQEPQGADLKPVTISEARPPGEGPARHGLLAHFAFELQRRRVSRTALSYALLVWVNVQIGDVVFPMTGLPDWTLRLIVVIGFMGLPLVIFLAWTFQVTPHGIKVDAGRPYAGGNGAGGNPRTVDMMINLSLLVTGVFLASLLLLKHASADEPAGAAPGAAPRVTLVRFQAASDRPANAAFVRGVEAEVRHKLIEMPGVTVISALEAGGPQDDTVLLSGSLYVAEGRVHALVHLLDVTSREYLWTLGFDLSASSVLEAEKSTAKRIVAEFRNALPGAARGI